MTKPPLTLLPAVDVVAGQAARLVQGDAGTVTTYGDPLAAALEWQNCGAQWVHLVDIDAAFGRGSNAALLADVVGALDVPVQLSGGVRDAGSLHDALKTGCARVNLSTAALEDPDWCVEAIAEYGERIAVGLDVRGSTLAARGGAVLAAQLFDTIARLDTHGCVRYVITDVATDGALTGPNLVLLKEVCAATSAPVISSGGVATLDDLTALRDLVPLGVEGAIVGTALYAKNFTLTDALKVAGEPSVS